MLRFGMTAFLLCAGTVSAGDFAPPSPEAVWSVESAEAAGYPYDVPYGGWPPGGYERRIGEPYYWSVPGGTVPLESVSHGGVSGPAAPVTPPTGGGSSCGCNKGASGYGDVGIGMSAGYAAAGSNGPAPAAGPAGDPYTYHFGPGFYRSGEFGHYRFPYYSYRRPWYDVGHPVRVRDTNLPW